MTHAPQPLTSEQVRKIARLAKLDPTPEEIERYRSDLTAVLSYMAKLDPVELAGSEPLVHVGGTVNRLDEDVPGPTLPQEAVLGLAPERNGPFIKVPKVLGGEGGGA